MIKYQSLNGRPFRKFLEDCSRQPQCRNLDLPGFLIKPVQRICKYPLLIKVRRAYLAFVSGRSLLATGIAQEHG